MGSSRAKKRSKISGLAASGDFVKNMPQVLSAVFTNQAAKMATSHIFYRK
jgi:hypothetical protein